MFYGNYASTLKADVIGKRNVNWGIGDYVCFSGGNSGTHCGGGQNSQVDGWDWFYDPSGPRVKVILATRKDGQVNSTGGDSGGPVYRNATSTRVYAVGMIQAGKGEVACGSVRFTPGSCTKTTAYTAIDTILNTIPGATLVTVP